MNQAATCLLVLSFPLFSALGQPGVRLLPSPLNHPSLNAWMPFVNPDGNAMLLLSDNTEGRVPKLFFTSRSGADWKDPAELPRALNSPANFRDGFSLSPDGRTILVSSSRPGGVGGYDIIGFSSSSPGNDGVNLGAPVNSKEHEASFVTTPDGNTAYFMRCSTMNARGADGCRIYSASRKNNTSRWELPAELPASINAGNSQFPRILADGVTLLFASDKHTPSTGGMDLYLTVRTEDGWSEPVPMEFLNTSGNDAMVTIQASGRNATTAVQSGGKWQLAEIPFPPSLKPVTVMKLTGRVTGHGKPEELYVTVVSGITGKPTATTRPDAAGNFDVYMNGGKRHLLFIEPSSDGAPFFLKTYDLQTGNVQARERLTVELPAISAGTYIDLTGINFNDGRPDPASFAVISRIMRLMRSNANLSFELAYGTGIAADSLKTGAVMDETSADLVKFLKDRGIANKISVTGTGDPSGSLILKAGGN